MSAPQQGETPALRIHLNVVSHIEGGEQIVVSAFRRPTHQALQRAHQAAGELEALARSSQLTPAREALVKLEDELSHLQEILTNLVSEPTLMKLLIADDDRVLTHLLSARLRAKGWTVTIALDAMQTVMFAIRMLPDVILLDINMPGGTGVDALKKLKMSTKTSQIPVVVLSGSIDPGDEPMVRMLGAEWFLKKPADIDEIHAILTRLTQIEPASA